ncbi:DUF445 domain-containing protein [Mycobacterium sp. M1]|uniref:DUF445 domain-containing protein n=1 Tax=Mycolicibacter acidiphilus TaxID=2835306 RepID=A0ABS5RKG4_9MYCO|nr:DUF445 domain-containing protein [Mycolicibacter acidiphilus]MBS9534793.1 DUF445 domain-containing protein [Mycolicibacter acidiphilus]
MPPATDWSRVWSDIVADFGLNWFIYLSMPLIAAFVGYITKLVVLQMLYRPLGFIGVGPIGWQGVVPRRAGKTAAMTIQTLTDKLLRPEDILAKVDAAQAVRDLQEPLSRTLDTMARELSEQIRPGVWDALPNVGRQAVLSRLQAAVPGIIDNLLTEMRQDLPRFIDLQYLAVTTLVKNKAQLNKLVMGMGDAAMKFIRRSGIYLGFGIGIVQMVAWGLFHNPWIMPGFGFVTGFASDWLALNLIFVPREPRRLLGCVTLHGVLHARRAQVTRDYARIMADDLFSTDVLIEAILHGPAADRLFAVVEREVSAALDRQVGMAGSALSLAIGTARYRRLKDSAVQTVLKHLSETAAETDDVRGYAKKTLGIEDLIVEKMDQLSPEQYEDILRPVFKDDEMLMVGVGAALGFAVGELQVVLIEHLAR